MSYWRTLFKKVTKKDLEEFDAKYKGIEFEHFLSLFISVNVEGYTNSSERFPKKALIKSQSVSDSGEERNDLKAAYLEYKGDMNRIMENVIGCHAEDEERFTNILKQMIEDGEVPDYSAFSNESVLKKKKRKKEADKEAKVSHIRS